MYTFDASSMIHAWDNYPADQFPPLWDWIADQINEKAVSIPTIAFEEVKGKMPECAKWLTEQGIKCIEVSNGITQEAFRIKGLLGIKDDKFHPKGVDENDIFIIATAKIERLELISDEGQQKSLSDKKSKYKIPAVCDMDMVAVRHVNFIQFIKRSGEVFR